MISSLRSALKRCQWHSRRLARPRKRQSKVATAAVMPATATLAHGAPTEMASLRGSSWPCPCLWSAVAHQRVVAPLMVRPALGP